MKLLYLTKVGMRPNEVGREKIEQALEKERSGGKTDGMPLSFYIENNLRPPDDVEDDSEIDSDGNINLTNEEMEEFYTEAILNLEDFSMVVDEEDEGSTVYTKSGTFINVAQDSDDVYDQIEYLNRNFAEKIRDYIQREIRLYKYRLQKKKQKLNNK